MTSEPSPSLEEQEQQLERLRRKMQRAARRRDPSRYRQLKAERDRLKGEYVTAAHEERRRVRRAAAAQQRQEQAERAERGWRLPFSRSPGARARDAAPPAPEAPQIPARGHLRPWRGEHPASHQIWPPT